MKESLYEIHLKALKNFDSEEEAIKYYQYMLDNNPESNVYPNSLREFHKGLIIGLKGSIEIRKSHQKVNCCVCGTECIKDKDCDGNWLCPDKDCTVHKEE